MTDLDTGTETVGAGRGVVVRVAEVIDESADARS